MKEETKKKVDSCRIGSGSLKEGKTPHLFGIIYGKKYSEFLNHLGTGSIEKDVSSSELNQKIDNVRRQGPVLPNRDGMSM